MEISIVRYLSCVFFEGLFLAKETCLLKDTEIIRYMRLVLKRLWQKDIKQEILVETRTRRKNNESVHDQQ